MKTIFKALFAAAPLVLLFANTAFPESPPSLDGTYRGTMVCSNIYTGHMVSAGLEDLVRFPLDIIVAGNTARFARPIVRNGEMVGTEMGEGTLESGALHLTSKGKVNGGQHYAGNYSGTITVDGGTLVGTQDWISTESVGTRPCTAAVVRSRT
jgi:hypothetical protein